MSASPTEPSRLAAWGVLYLDHLAVTTGDFERTLADYLHLPGSRLLRGPGRNDGQRVRYAFVALVGGPVVEVLAAEAASPIAAHVQRGGGAYHLCYAVADLDKTVAAARGDGAQVIVAPTPDSAFDGRRIAFVVAPGHGLVEFVEAYPPRGQTAPPDVAQETCTDLDVRLAGVFLRQFPELTDATVATAAIDHTPGWDSMAQLQLMMAIEETFRIAIPTAHIASATDYRSVQELVRRCLPE